MSTEADERAVLQANAAYYAAFVSHDLAAMETLWARQADVACVHPGWDALRGRERVLASFRAIFEGGAPPLVCSGPTVHFAGKASAFVLCTEVLPGAALVATNLFVREEGRFRLVLHQASPAARAPAPPPSRSDLN